MKQGPSLAKLDEIVVIPNAPQRLEQRENVTMPPSPSKGSECRPQILQTARAAGELDAKLGETTIVVLL